MGMSVNDEGARLPPNRAANFSQRLPIMHRREFLTGAAVPVAALAASKAPELLKQEERHSRITSSTAYKYRVAFGAWMNDMRMEPLPLEEWPARSLTTNGQ